MPIYERRWCWLPRKLDGILFNLKQLNPGATIKREEESTFKTHRAEIINETRVVLWTHTSGLLFDGEERVLEGDEINQIPFLRHKER